eukprot:Polyplicarium_translucidae@DN3104_c0_g1_i2.p1
MPSPNPFIDDQAASEDERESNPPDAAGGDEEDEDGATPSKRKHRSLKKRSKRGKRRRREGARHEEEFDPRQDPEDTIPVPGGIDSDMDVMSEEDEPDDDGARPVDEKKKMRKRGGGFEITPEEAMGRARDVIRKMVEAAEADERSVLSGRVAVAKLELIDHVVAEVSKPKWMLWYLQEGVCEALGRWLRPLADGSLPSLTIRSKVLELLTKLPVAAEHLQRNDLGRRVVALWKSSAESEENRQLIRIFVHSVLRPVLGLRQAFRTARETEDTSAETRSRVDVERSSEAALGLVPSNADPWAAKSRRARVPVAAGFNFKIMPRSTFEGKTRPGRDGESTMGRLHKLVETKTRHRPSRKSTQGQAVSVTKGAA